MVLNLAQPNTLPGIEDRRALLSSAFAISLTSDVLPSEFPIDLWNAQSQRYIEYWQWFRGDKLNEYVDGVTTKDGKKVYKFPLRINTIRNFARKHASVLFGEAPDSAEPLAKTIVRPKNPLDGKEVSDEQEKVANYAQNVINEIWSASGGRAIQMEAGTLSQFLGGCVFQVCWHPQRNDLMFPIVIKHWPADFFLPVWNDNPWDLVEAFLVYSISRKAARDQFGIEISGTNGVYVEHWTKDSYSIFVDGAPITSNLSGVLITYNNVKNPFGFVPFVYIPHLREGNFYGSSLVEDLKGLVEEYNGRLADYGDAVHTTVKRRRYGRNLAQQARERFIGEGTKVIDLGQQAPGVKDPPEVYTEDPPTFSEGLTSINETLWDQLTREGNMSDTAFGEEEGSQRSALSLAFKMWPSTSHSRSERSFWGQGIATIARFIITIGLIKNLFGKNIPKDFLKDYSVYPDWMPHIPREREALISEVINRFSQGLMSPEKALEEFGDVKNIPEEISMIKDWLQFQSSLEMADKEPPKTAKDVELKPPSNNFND